jgi:polysaccharide export outer membrane protein
MFAVVLLAMVFVFGPGRGAQAQDGYVIQPGDTLQIEVLEDPGLNRSTLVLPGGGISFPMAGSVQAGGRTIEQLRQNLAEALGPNFAVEPNVYVSVAALGQQQAAGGGARASGPVMDVYAIGQVAVPGRIETKQGTTLLQFLAEIGGLTKFAAEKRIELHRTDKKTGAVTTYLFNYRTPAGSASGISGSTKLAPGDVVKVPQRRLFE